MDEAQAGARTHRIAIYDLDRTITRRPTWTPFLVHAASRAPWRFALVPLVGVAAALNALGVIDRRSLKQVMHRLLLGTQSRVQVQALADRFAQGFLVRHVGEDARARIAADRAAGYRIVIATAAHRFYASAIAAGLGVDDVIATEAAEDTQGRILPRIVGDNCYGPAKLRMVEAWMAGAGIDRWQAHVRFYSDHASDEPTLAWADEAFAVNAHPPLRHLAGLRGWAMLDWR